jgi:FkbM family methyltransferase
MKRFVTQTFNTMHIERLPNYVKEFGPVSGLVAYCQTHLLPQNGRAFSLRAGPRRIQLRRTASDTSIFFQIFVKREYDTAQWCQHNSLNRKYRAILDDGRVPVIVDAGANIGLSAIWFGQRFPEARIFAIEPDPENLAILTENIRTNSRITPLQGAVWDRPAQLIISNPKAGAGAFRVVEGEGPLRAYSVREIVGMQERGALFIVKIDIEGGEAALFRSNIEWVAEPALIAIELHDWLYPGEHTSSNFLRAISSIPVDVLFRGENVFCFKSGSAT